MSWRQMSWPYWLSPLAFLSGIGGDEHVAIGLTSHLPILATRGLCRRRAGFTSSAARTRDPRGSGPRLRRRLPATDWPRRGHRLRRRFRRQETVALDRRDFLRVHAADLEDPVVGFRHPLPELFPCSASPLL